MHWLSFLLAAACLLLAASADITHLAPTPEYLFYLSQPSGYFGFISRESGEVTSRYELQPHEQIISVQKQAGTVVLRSSREKALLFDIGSAHIRQVEVEIAFSHQRIGEVVRMKGQEYVLTEKDVRVYEEGQARKGEERRNIVSSARKNEFFKKVIIEQGQSVEDMQIVLVRNQEVCIRSFRRVKRGTDECYFRTPYEISSVDRVGNSLLIQTPSVNYVITPNVSFYSFKGAVTQLSQEYVLLSDFRTYDLRNQMFIDGLIAQGSSHPHIFWLYPRPDAKATLYYNSDLVGELPHQPKRAWVFPSETLTRFQLILELADNRLDMYEIEVRDGSIGFERKWQTQPLQQRRVEEL